MLKTPPLPDDRKTESPCSLKAKALPKWTSADIDHALPHLLAADAALKDTKVSSEAQIVTSLLLAITPNTSRRKAA